MEENVRTSGHPIPDLTLGDTCDVWLCLALCADCACLAAETVALSVQELVVAGRASTETGDDQLQSRMPAACEQVCEARVRS